jgi:uncharacterized protein (DUF1697 family)
LPRRPAIAEGVEAAGYTPAMPRYVAFLRAINVGGHVVTMDRLRSLCERMGLANVGTFIASGNVIFESPARSAKALEAKIATDLRKNLGYDVATFLRTDDEVAEIAAYRPFPPRALAAAGSRLYVGFLATALGPAPKKAALALATQVDELHLHGRELYWLCHVKFKDAEFTPARLEKTLRIQATFRNITTVKKIAAKYAPAKS